MIDASEIAEVRRNSDVPLDGSFGAVYTDDLISEIVEGTGINRASAIIWREKAASYAKMVDVNESGSSRSFSDLSKNALAMAKEFEAAAERAGEPGGDTGTVEVSERAKVRIIERS